MTSPPSLSTGSARRLAVLALLVLALSALASVVAFVRGDVLVGVVWILLVGLSSNMGWYYLRRFRRSAAAAAAPSAPTTCSAAGPAATPQD